MAWLVLRKKSSGRTGRCVAGAAWMGARSDEQAATGRTEAEAAEKGSVWLEARKRKNQIEAGSRRIAAIMTKGRMEGNARLVYMDRTLFDIRGVL